MEEATTSTRVTTGVPTKRAVARGVGLALHEVTHRFGHTLAVDAVILEFA